MFETLLGRIAAALKKAGIGYMVIGGQAVLLYGEPRLTKDIDITLSVDTDRLPDIMRLVRILRLRALADDPEKLARETKVFPAVQDSTGVRVDFIFSSSEFEKVAISRARRTRLGRHYVMFASLEDLLIHKIVAGRPRDIEDVKSVLLKNRQYDRGYVEDWLGKFDKALDTGHVTVFKSITREIG